MIVSLFHWFRGKSCQLVGIETVQSSRTKRRSQPAVQRTIPQQHRATTDRTRDRRKIPQAFTGMPRGTPTTTTNQLGSSADPGVARRRTTRRRSCNARGAVENQAPNPMTWAGVGTTLRTKTPKPRAATTNRRRSSVAAKGTPQPATRETILRSRRTHEADRAPQDEADDPVTGWLVVVAGPGKGRSLTLGAGRNEIGRGASANVKLDFGDREVSRDAHAYITYDDEARLWYVQQGGGRNLVRLAGRPVLEPIPLQAHAEIRIGRTHLVFVPFCGEDFDWEDLGKQE